MSRAARIPSPISVKKFLTPSTNPVKKPTAFFIKLITLPIALIIFGNLSTNQPIKIITKKYFTNQYLLEVQSILLVLFLCFSEALIGPMKKNIANEAIAINEKKIRFESTNGF